MFRGKLVACHNGSNIHTYIHSHTHICIQRTAANLLAVSVFQLGPRAGFNSAFNSSWSRPEKRFGCRIINSFNLTGANLNMSKQQQQQQRPQQQPQQQWQQHAVSRRLWTRLEVQASLQRRSLTSDSNSNSASDLDSGPVSTMLLPLLPIFFSSSLFCFLLPHTHTLTYVGNELCGLAAWLIWLDCKICQRLSA